MILLTALNSSKLTQSAKRNLDKIVGQIRGHGYLGAIRITGNTCGLGDPAYDQRLSEKRANAVRAYLIDKGFNPEHLIARGLGKGSPKYDRKDDDFRNRRVDLEYVTERTVKKAANKTQYRDVLVQEGRPAVAPIPGRTNRDTTMDVLANDSTGLTLVRVSQPTGGTVTIVNDRVVYVANPGFSGTDTFTYTVEDAEGNETTSRVTVDVPVAVNNAPMAVDDNASTSESTAVMIDVIANDTDSDGDNAGFSGSDTFTYTITDGNNTSCSKRFTNHTTKYAS